MKNEINDAIHLIMNEELKAIGRASDLLWLGFGEDTNYQDRFNRKHNVSKYSLHVQCPWRFLLNNEILLGSADIYQPSNDRSYGDFDWDINGMNLFDNKKNLILDRDKKQLIVSNINISSNGSMEISFNDGLQFDILPCCSIKQEFWRFIFFDKEPIDYVVF